MFSGSGKIITSLKGIGALIPSLVAGTCPISTDPNEDNVRDGVTYKIDDIDYEGNLVVPSANDLRDGVGAGTSGTEITGNIQLAPADKIIEGQGNGSNATEIIGTYHETLVSEVQQGVTFGASGSKVGTLVVITPSGIAYQPPIFSGQKTSYANYDTGWRHANGYLNYTPPANPTHLAQLDLTHATPFLKLKNNNVFGNKDRFTDTSGGLTNIGNLVIDHLTGYMWYAHYNNALAWSSALSTAWASTQGGYSGWFVPDPKEYLTVVNADNTRMYYGIWITAGTTLPSAWLQLWTSGTNLVPTTSAYWMYYSTGHNVLSNAKTGAIGYLICRRHYV